MSNILPPAKTIEEQISILKERGLIIVDNTRAHDILTQFGYYNLINGYKEPFIDKALTQKKGKDSYKKNSTLEEIHTLAEFDSELRLEFFKFTSLVETRVKSIISLHFSNKYGSSHKDFLNENSFRKHTKYPERIPNLIKQIKDDIKYKGKNHPALKHYKTKHQAFPLWVINCILSFGKLSTFYKNLQDPLKKIIAQDIHPDITPKTMDSMLYFLTTIRNKCAHGNRLIYHRKDSGRDLSIPKLPIHDYLKIELDKNNKYIHGTNDILAALMCTYYFLYKSNLFEFDFNRIIEHVKLTEENITSLPENFISDTTGLKEDHLKNFKDLIEKNEMKKIKISFISR